MIAPGLDVHVLSTAHHVADARLRRLCEAFVGQGLNVLLEAVGDDAGQAPAGVDVILHAPSSRTRRAGRSLVRPVLTRSACLVVVDPDTMPSALVRRRVRRDCRLVADVHEDYSALLRDRTWAVGAAGVLARASARVLARLTARADLVVVADSHLLPDAPRRLVVRNLPPLREFKVYAADPSPRAVYIGDVRRSRGLVEMVEGVLSAPPWTLDVVGPVSDQDRGWAAARATAAGRPDAVRFHGRLHSAGSWAVARGAWVGLALLHDTPAFREAVPTKVYEYAAAGMPTVASSLPRVRALLEESGGGVVADGSEAVAAVLREWSADPSAPAALGRRARAWAERELGTASPFDVLAAQVVELVKDSRQ